MKFAYSRTYHSTRDYGDLLTVDHLLNFQCVHFFANNCHRFIKVVPLANFTYMYFEMCMTLNQPRPESEQNIRYEKWTKPLFQIQIIQKVQDQIVF